MPGAVGFGPFVLDLRAHRLFRDGAAVDVPARQVDLLALLVERAGELVTRDDLVRAFWADVFVTDNTITRAVADLRRTLGDAPHGSTYVQTVARRGYRFVAGVRQLPEAAPAAQHPARSRPAPAGLADAEELMAFVRSVDALESFDLAALPDTRARLERTCTALPDYAPAHVALASACAIAFEASRSAGAPDAEALRRAVAGARRACELDSGLGESWATLAFALSVGQAAPEEARAAARQALRLEPDSWRHHVRLALATWGEERLRAVQRALALAPGSAFACLLGAMVNVARDVRDRALGLLDLGVGAQDQQAASGASRRLPAAGLHWLRGAVRAVGEGALGAALADFDEEIARHDACRLYSTEFVVNAWCWRGGTLWRTGCFEQGRAAFEAALALRPRHARALAGIAVLDRALAAGPEPATGVAEVLRSRLDELRTAGHGLEAALVEAGVLATGPAPQSAGPLLLDALASAPAGQAGWTIPIDPFLQPLRGTAAFGEVLAALANRAL